MNRFFGNHNKTAINIYFGRALKENYFIQLLRNIFSDKVTFFHLIIKPFFGWISN